MKRIAITVLTFGLLMGIWIRGADAAERCWNLAPFTDDIIKASVINEGNGHRSVHGRWFSPGNYSLPLSGSLENEGADRHLGGIVTNNTVHFGGFPDCVVDAVLSTTTTPPLEGPFTADCGAGGFVVTATMERINCTTLVPLSATATGPTVDRGMGE